MRTFRRAAVRDIVLGVLAVALVGVAIFYFVRNRGGEEAAPTDAGSYTYWLCEACGEFFHLSGADLDRIYKRREFSTTKDERAAMRLRCKKCGQDKAVRASKCPQHGDVVKDLPGPNDPRKCSKCDFRGS